MTRKTQSKSLRWPLTVGAIALALALAGCLAAEDRDKVPASQSGGSGGGGNGAAFCGTVSVTGTLNWQYVYTNVFSATGDDCEGCHGGASPSGNLSLASDQYATIVTGGKKSAGGVLIVAPGDPANSYLIQKIDPGGTMNSKIGSTAKRDIICNWIQQGAVQ